MVTTKKKSEPYLETTLNSHMEKNKDLDKKIADLTKDVKQLKQVVIQLQLVVRKLTAETRHLKNHMHSAQGQIQSIQRLKK